MKRINSLDVTKFILSFFIIGLHTLYLIDTPIAHNRFLITILKIAVPFFFITSGYLLFSKVEFPMKKEDGKKVFRYLKHIFIMYVIWTIIYLPLSIYGAVIGKVHLIEFIIYMTRKFLFVGEFYYSWNLWYLHGLIIAILLTYILLKLKIKPKYIFFISVVVFILGLFLDSIIGTTTSSNLLNKFLNLYVYLFERVRNGLFKGFVYVAIGLLLSKNKKINIKYGIIIAIIGFIIFYFKYEIGLLLLAPGIFIIIYNIDLKDKKIYDYFRDSSILIYLFHMLFIFIYLVIIKKNNDYNPISLCLFTSLNCLIVSSLIYYLKRYIPFLNILYGKINFIKTKD